MKEPTIITLGCRLNAYESEVVRRHASAADLGPCVIVNTCAVTGEAVRQARQTIRKLRRETPAARIVVTGCAAQIEPDHFAAMSEVDHVFGNDDKMQASTWQALTLDTSERVQVNDIMGVRETASHMIGGFGSRARAYVQVQNGCDHRCTFCIIPFGRGPSRSVPAGEVVRETRHLVEKGYNEIVLTGVDLTSYGSALPGRPTLGKLVRQILAHVPELPRLRLSSIDQVEADQHLLDALANEPRLMPHLHLSLQAGDDIILKRMKRRHLRDDAIAFCEAARRLRPDIVFGADIIAGFPTETDDMFENSLRLVEACGLTYLHVFPFSARNGTPAACMPRVPAAVIKDRARRLREAGSAALARHLDSVAGSNVDILLEKPDGGRTAQFTEVALQTSLSQADVGAIVRAHVTGHNGQRLKGAILHDQMGGVVA